MTKPWCPDRNEDRKNVASRNALHGIELETNGSTVTDNTANDNEGWGILSTGASIDGGGNSASGNGQAAQCSGIACD